MIRLGLDFGTSTTLASVREGRELPHAIAIALDEIRTIMPSVARRLDGGGLLVGERAEEQLPLRELIKLPKLAITRGIHDLQELGLAAGGPADEVIAAILSEAVDRIRGIRGLAGNIKVNLSCPSSWDWRQRSRFLSAAAHAGIETRGRQILIDEPVAAGAGWAEWSVAQGRLADRSRLLVVDIGGGTLDVALVDVAAGADSREFRVLASMGSELGGERVDKLVAEEIARLVDREDLIDHLESPRTSLSEDGSLLLREAERVKQLLAESDVAPLSPSSRLLGRRSAEIDATRLMELTSDYVDEIVRFAQGVSRQGLLAHGRSRGDVLALGWRDLGITDILFVGGGSRLRGLRERLRERVPEARISSEETYLPAEEMVVRGLAIGEESFAMSLDRPHFSVMISMSGEEVGLYGAYDPLYDVSLINDRPAFRRTVRLPSNALNIELILENVGGQQLKPRGDAPELSWELAPGARELHVTLYPDGVFRMSTNSQNLTQLRLPNWNPFQVDFLEIIDERTESMFHFRTVFEEGAPG